MIILEAIKPVFINGVIIDEGDKFSCPLDFGKKLIESQSAKEIEIRSEPTIGELPLEEATIEELTVKGKPKGTGKAVKEG